MAGSSAAKIFDEKILPDRNLFSLDGRLQRLKDFRVIIRSSDGGWDVDWDKLAPEDRPSSP
jgi:hypothetical protein